MITCQSETLNQSGEDAEENVTASLIATFRDRQHSASTASALRIIPGPPAPLPTPQWAVLVTSPGMEIAGSAGPLQAMRPCSHPKMISCRLWRAALEMGMCRVFRSDETGICSRLRTRLLNSSEGPRCVGGGSRVWARVAASSRNIRNLTTREKSP